MKKFILLFSTTLILSAAFAQSQKLSYNLKQGETYRQNISTNMLIKQSMMGQTMEVNTFMEMHAAFKVIELTAAGYKFEAVYSKITANTSISGMGDMKYSSEEDAETTPGFENMSKLFKALKNNPFTVEMTKEGEVIGVAGLTALCEKIIADLDVGDAVKEQLQASIEQQFNDDAFIAQFKCFVYPDKALSAGDSWTQRSTINNMVELNMETTYTVKSISGAELVLDVSSTVEAREQGVEIQGTPAMANITGTQKGTAVIHLATGWLSSSEVTQTMKGEIEVQGMKIPIEMQGTTTIIKDK